MKDDFKEDYGFEARLATENEIDILSGYLANSKWEDYKQSKNSLGLETSTKEQEHFIIKEKAIILELIGSIVVVQEYKKFNVSIFVFNYIEEHDKNSILSMTFRVLQTKRGMEKLESEDVIFNLKSLKEHPYHKKQTKKGRHDRPKNESIQKTIVIRNYLKVNPNENRDIVCNKFGLSKSTYYRTLKWLENRKN